MSQIRCTQKLWRTLGQSGRPERHTPEPLLCDVALGSWAAKVFRIDRRDLVLTLEERTYLTLVFPLPLQTHFRANFAVALTAVLSDLGIPERFVQIEVAALDFHPFARLRDRRMAGALNDLEFHCGIEMEYHDDLRRVQRNLNDVPHANREPCVPAEAIWQVFSARRASSTHLIH